MVVRLAFGRASHGRGVIEHVDRKSPPRTDRRPDEQLPDDRGRQPRAVHSPLSRATSIECIRPASGMATALDPIMRACGGTWVAHGTGDADRLTVDEHDRVRVPPENPATPCGGSG